MDVATSPSLFSESQSRCGYSSLLLLCSSFWASPWVTGHPWFWSLQCPNIVWSWQMWRKGRRSTIVPRLSEGFLCPLAGRHDQNTFQLTTAELYSPSRSGASLWYLLLFPTVLMLQTKPSFILSTFKCKLPVLPLPCSQFASKLFKMCRFVNVFTSF